MIYNRDIYESVKDLDFAEHFLGRLASDCDYVLNSCMDAYEKGYYKPRKGALRHLWAQDIDEQISLMKACKRTLDMYGIKSKISIEDINNYESELKKIENFNESNLSFLARKKESRKLYEDMKYSNKSFDRTIETDVIKPYESYYKNLNFSQDYDNEDEQNFSIDRVAYNEESKTLKIKAKVYFKAYGDSYEKRCIYKADRASYYENTFIFDKALSRNLSEIIFPIGLVKCGSGYPTRNFQYTEICYHSKLIKPNKLYWVDHIILDVTKIYD